MDLLDRFHGHHLKRATWRLILGFIVRVNLFTSLIFEKRQAW